MLHQLVRTKEKRKYIGRGGSRGGQAGRGHKGQKARTSALVRMCFEGGQTPLIRRVPKRGFNNAAFGTKYNVISLEVMYKLCKKHNLTTIGNDFLYAHGLCKSTENVKILFSTVSDDLKMPITLVVNACSKKVRDAVEAAGGKVEIVA